MNAQAMKKIAYQMGLALVMGIMYLIVHITNSSRAAGAFNAQPAIEAIPGLCIIFGIVLLGLVLKQLIPLPLPAIAYCVLIACIITIPGFIPGYATFTYYMDKVNFMCLAVPGPACIGISTAKDLQALKKAGLPLLVLTILTIVGSFLGSAVVADVVLKLTGQI